jgi:signal transduction histidine kinase/streptogramin lyase
MAKLLLFLFSFFVMASAKTQQQSFFETLTEKDGLSDNRVTCFLKDRSGFLWVGTKNGLNRYNGYDFSMFIPVKNSISNELINDIEEDKDGFIWVSTMNGLNRFHPNKKTWQRYDALGVDTARMLLNPIVWDSYIDEDNRLWLASDLQGVSVFNSQTQEFTHYPWKRIVPQLLPQYTGRYFSVLKILPRTKDELWLATTFGLVVFNKVTGRYSVTGHGYEAYSLEMLYNQTQRKVFITLSGNRIFCYDEVKKSFKELTVVPIPYPSVLFSLPTIQYDWVGASDGLMLIDAASNKVYLQKHIPELSVSIPEGCIRDVYKDNSGITWLASDNGIVKYDGNNQLASFLPLMNVSDRIGDNPMSGMLYDAEGDRYFLCSVTKAIVFVVNRKTNTIETIRGTTAGKRFASCRNVRKDRAGTIWLLADEAVYQYSNSLRGFVQFPMPAGKGGFRDVIVDTDGNYWFSGFMGSISFYDTQKKKFTIPADSATFAGIVKSNPLFLDTINGNVWIGTFSHGVYKYNLKTKAFTLYNESPKAKHYTPLNLVHDITQDKTGAVWVATHSGGILKYVDGLPYEKSFSVLSMSEGLSSNNIYSVKAIDSNLWVVSGNHLFTVNIYTNKITRPVSGKQVFPFTSYSSDDYWPQRLAYDAARNEISIAAGGGVMFLEHKKTMNTERFPLVLNAVVVNGQPLADSLLLLQRTAFGSPVKDLVISFSALHYSLPQLLQYEYKLEGADIQWQQAVYINNVHYQNLPAGTYHFKLRAKTFHGTASKNEVSFAFIVKPFLYQTWWFRLFCVLVVAAILYSIYKYQLNKKLEVERLRHRISRDLHDDIGSALTTINVLSKVALNKGDDQTSVQGYLTRIKDSAQQTMESMSDIVWAINPINDSIESMLVRMKEYAAELCEARGIELKFDADNSINHHKLDVAYRKNVFLIFKEAVNNAVKYSNCKNLLITLANFYNCCT